jgi:hypothetical protein
MMTGEHHASNAGSGLRSAVLYAIVMACTSSLILGCRKASAPATANTAAAARVEDPVTHQLRLIGDRVAVAMVARDINPLLEYDHYPDDQASLKSKSGDVYCYVFDSTCITGGRPQSVYDLFSTAPRLGIDASVVNVEGKHYGLLMFYDKSQISDQELYSPDFLCSAKAQTKTATWHFILTDGKWTTTTVFDYKTDKPCGNNQSGNQKG